MERCDDASKSGRASVTSYQKSEEDEALGHKTGGGTGSCIYIEGGRGVWQQCRRQQASRRWWLYTLHCSTTPCQSGVCPCRLALPVGRLQEGGSTAMAAPRMMRRRVCSGTERLGFCVVVGVSGLTSDSASGFASWISKCPRFTDAVILIWS